MVRSSAKYTAALIASGALTATAFAQAPPSQTPPAPTPEQMTPAPTAPATSPTAPTATKAVEVDDQQIRSFALALVEIDKIRTQYQPQLKGAPAEQQQALKEEANARMAAAVEAQGLEPQTFNAISAAAQEDPELRNKIREQAAKAQPATP